MLRIYNLMGQYNKKSIFKMPIPVCESLRMRISVHGCVEDDESSCFFRRAGRNKNRGQLLAEDDKLSCFFRQSALAVKQSKFFLDVLLLKDKLSICLKINVFILRENR